MQGTASLMHQAVATRCMRLGSYGLLQQLRENSRLEAQASNASKLLGQGFWGHALAHLRQLGQAPGLWDHWREGRDRDWRGSRLGGRSCGLDLHHEQLCAGQAHLNCIRRPHWGL